MTTLPNIIVTQDGDLLNLSHIIRIHADLREGYNNTYYRVMASLDIIQSGRTVEWPLISFDTKQAQNIYADEETAKKYCVELYLRITENLSNIIDYQQFRTDFDTEFDKLQQNQGDNP